MQLDKIESPELKNEVLDALGTKNFQQKLQAAIDRERVEKFLTMAENAVKQYAEKIEVNDYLTMDYISNYSRWHITDEITLPDDIQTAKYYYKADSSGITLYRDKADAPVDAEKEARLAAEAERQQRLETLKSQLAEITVRAYRLRKDFVKDFGAGKKRISEICIMAINSIMSHKDYRYSFVHSATLSDIFNIPYEDSEVDFSQFKETIASHPEHSLLSVAFSTFDYEDNGYWKEVWDTEKRAYCIRYAPNDKLDALYVHLANLGYEVSDEEAQMMNGNHPLFTVDLDA